MLREGIAILKNLRENMRKRKQENVLSYYDVENSKSEIRLLGYQREDTSDLLPRFRCRSGSSRRSQIFYELQVAVPLRNICSAFSRERQLHTESRPKNEVRKNHLRPSAMPRKC